MKPSPFQIITRAHAKESGVANPQVGGLLLNRNHSPLLMAARSMFIGEFGCCLPLIWRYFTSGAKGSPFSKASSDSRGYTAVAQDDGETAPVTDGEVGQQLTGWRICLLWFPAFCDSEFLRVLV